MEMVMQLAVLLALVCVAILIVVGLVAFIYWDEIVGDKSYESDYDSSIDWPNSSE